MPREILVHLNVEVPDSDSRSEDEIAGAIVAKLDGLDGLVIVAPLAEEI